MSRNGVTFLKFKVCLWTTLLFSILRSQRFPYTNLLGGRFLRPRFAHVFLVVIGWNRNMFVPVTMGLLWLLILLLKNRNKWLWARTITFRTFYVGIAIPSALKPLDIIVVKLYFDDQLLSRLIGKLLIVHCVCLFENIILKRY
jgi:hypothetical protein